MLIVIVNAIIAGLIAAAGSIMAAAIEGGNVLPSKGAWIVAACVFIMSAGKDWQSHVSIPPPKVITAALAALCLLLAGCVGPQFGGMNAEETLDLMKAQNARGCVYVRGSATPWAAAGFMLVGTWGSDPPPYRECFDRLPLLP